MLQRLYLWRAQNTTLLYLTHLRLGRISLLEKRKGKEELSPILPLNKARSWCTRTSIAHVIAKKHGILWQNIYSGIFRDLDEVLIPSGVVKEGGRLPLRRGPRALQLEGYILWINWCRIVSGIIHWRAWERTQNQVFGSIYWRTKACEQGGKDPLWWYTSLDDHCPSFRIKNYQRIHSFV